MKADVPALLGLDVLDCGSLMADTVANRLSKRKVALYNGSHYLFYVWHVQLFQSQSGHVYVEMNFYTLVLFTRVQLGKLHKQFFHLLAEKLFNLLKRTKPEETSSET